MNLNLLITILLSLVLEIVERVREGTMVVEDLDAQITSAPGAAVSFRLVSDRVVTTITSIIILFNVTLLFKRKEELMLLRCRMVE